jgi:hypothetical protein
MENAQGWILDGEITRQEIKYGLVAQIEEVTHDLPLSLPFLP